MKIGNDNEYIEMIELERTPGGTPGAGDVHLQVNLKLQEFYGTYSGVWLDVPAMTEFLNELETLDTSRKGEAKIVSMSPEEFILIIRSSDNLGHMEIEAQLSRHQYSGPKYWPIFLRGGFEAQPETIRELISCFQVFTK